VTHGLHRLGFDTAVGVCDSANVAVTSVARRTGAPIAEIDFEVYGLNHLSWTRRVAFRGADLLGPALDDHAFAAQAFPSFAASDIRALGRVPVEYLCYFYRTADTLAAMKAEPMTRGETLVASNRAMLADVGRLSSEGAVGDAMVRYASWLTERHATYMRYARGEHVTSGRPASVALAMERLKGWVGGYAEVALDLMTARTGAAPSLMALNVANRGAIAGLEADDVIESDCDVSAEGVNARRHAPLPAEDLRLIQRVKEYERLAVRAILEESRELAIDALVAHPLVGSREVASRLVEVVRHPGA
jgi:6-phospho-beta-glucosidase